ncbi:PAP2 superfamily C-terminal-domain-containing protein [Scenedesmus sp. NREL 46B-D3]|nr:PAP2 superfamily C-terminal-domain-containing protein [Scenedesmus sp. NREL 46B-D3]
MEHFIKTPDGSKTNCSLRQRFKNEVLLLRSRWHVILLGLVFQYVHGIFTQLAYRMHQPAAQPLHDVGFQLEQELPAGTRWVSEAIFTVLLLSFVGWTFTPLLARPSSFSTVVLWTRLLTVLVVCQSLRILSFSATQLPGPAPHCHAGTPTATRAPVAAWWRHLVVDVGRQVATSCGDLIFSSHMTFILTGVLAYTHYGSKRLVKAAAWAAAAVLAVLIIAARKHYTVDVVIAWYTVPMVYTLLHVFWRQRCSSSYAVLPTTADADDRAAGQPAVSCCVTDVPVSNKQHIELQSSWKAAGHSCSSCDGSLDSGAGAAGSSSYCSSYNISPSSASGHAGAAHAGVGTGTGRTVSPRRPRNVWLFGQAPWRQQQPELASSACGSAVDMESQA